MNHKGHAGMAAIWGAGCVLMGIGLVLFLASLKENQVGIPQLALLEGFIGVVFIVFGIISLYIAHK